MRTFIFLLFIGFAISMSSCREDFEFEPSTGNLTFSKDTVYCDTVFTNISSSTYSLKVYNKSNKDIKIPTIRLARPDSKYRITVDGMTGENQNNRTFKDVELLAKDSMYIFIEVTADVVMLKIHHDGRAVCGVYTKDVAATKVELVLAAARRGGHPLQCIMEAA